MLQENQYLLTNLFRVSILKKLSECISVQSTEFDVQAAVTQASEELLELNILF